MRYAEIWFVNFSESVGHEYKKDRPVLIVQSNRQLGVTNMVTIIPLTSNLKNRRQDDILIQKDSNNRLHFDSLLKVYHMKSFDYSRFIRKIGIASNEIMDSVKLYLRKHFDI